MTATLSFMPSPFIIVVEEHDGKYGHYGETLFGGYDTRKDAKKAAPSIVAMLTRNRRPGKPLKWSIKKTSTQPQEDTTP